MKKIFAATVLAVVFLTGCGSAGGTTNVSAKVNKDQAFLNTVSDQMDTSDIPDSDLIDLGHNICNGLDNGLTFIQIGQIGINNGMSAYNSGFVIGASVYSYCPEYKDELSTDY